MHPAGPIVVALAAGALLWNSAEALRGLSLWPGRQRALVALLVTAGAVLSVLTCAARVLVGVTLGG